MNSAKIDSLKIDGVYRVVKIEMLSGRIEYAVQKNEPHCGFNGEYRPEWWNVEISKTEEEAMYMYKNIYKKVNDNIVKEITILTP